MSRRSFSTIFSILFILAAFLAVAAICEASPQNRFTYSVTRSGSVLTVTVNYAQESFDGLDATLYQPRVVELWPQWNNAELELTGIVLGQAAILAEKELTHTSRVTPEDAAWSEVRAIIMNSANTNRVAPGKVLILTFNILKNPSSTLKWRVDRCVLAPEEAQAYLILEEKAVSLASNLYAGFANAGIWQWGGSGWSRLTPDNPESIVAAGTNLYGKFANGIWQWTGSGWTHLTPDRPASMVASGANLYGNFTGNGIWKWGGSGWTQLTPDNPETMVASGSNLYGKFANGIWQWTGSGWNKLTPDRPAEMVAAGSNLYGNFTGNGIWQWSGTNWIQLTPDNPESMVAAGSNLYGKFGNGIWQWTGSGWNKLTPDSPASMAAAGSILYGTFTGNGIWQWNGTNWTQLTPDNPAMMAVSSTSAPILASIGNKTIDEGTTLSFVISATDADGGTLTYSASALPSGATFDANSRTFSWTPTYSQSGTYQITFTVQDDSGGSDAETITITVNDKTPVFSVMDYFPLNIGDWHDYRVASTGQVHRTNTTGPTYIGGVATKAKTYWDGQKEYYTADANGVKLYGQYVISQYITGDIYFSSPLLIMPNNAQIGKTQVSSSSYAFSLYGSTYHVNITSTTTVLGLEDVQTANTILKDCIKVSIKFDEYIVETGQSVPGSTIYYWFYKGVGCVKQFMDGDTYTITSSYVNGVQQSY